MEHVKDSTVLQHNVVIQGLGLNIRHLEIADHGHVFGLTVEDEWALCVEEVEEGLRAYPNCGIGAFTDDGQLVCEYANDWRPGSVQVHVHKYHINTSSPMLIS